MLYVPGPMRTQSCINVLNKRARKTQGGQASSHQSSETHKIGSRSIILGDAGVISDFQQQSYCLKSFQELGILSPTKILFIFFYQILLVGAQSCVTPLWPYCHFIMPQARVAVSEYNVHHRKNTYTMKSPAPKPVSAAPAWGLYFNLFPVMQIMA